MNRTVAVVNVRLGSTRLPGKALREVCGRPMLAWLLGRLAAARGVDEIVIATSVLAINDPIEAFAQQRGIRCHRGPEDDVLARTVGAFAAAGATTGVLVYGDGPLIDPAIVETVLARFGAARPPADFVGNDLETSYPPGMEVEVLRCAALADADRRCTDPAIREHGTLFVRRNPQLYLLENLRAPDGLRRPDLSLEVDTDADLEVLEAVLTHFAPRADFRLAEIIRFLDANPGIAARNRDVPRRWKEFRNDA